MIYNKEDMTNQYGIYGNLPEENEKATLEEKWRLQNCSQMEEDIKKDIIEYSSKLKKIKNRQKKTKICI